MRQKRTQKKPTVTAGLLLIIMVQQLVGLSALALAVVSVRGFSAVSPTRTLQQGSRWHGRVAVSSPTVALRMSDFDFPSAMPEKPTLSTEEKLQESATAFIVDLSGRLGKGVDPPVELEALINARDDPNPDKQTLALRIYELMIEQGMSYDMDAETGVFTPTQFDIKSNLEIPEVKAEFAHLYKYGMELIKREMIDVNVAKVCVKDRLIKRTGLSPEEFDAWLGY